MEYVKRKSCETNMILVAAGYCGRFSFPYHDYQLIEILNSNNYYLFNQALSILLPIHAFSS